jgi:hypothetical protein
MHSHDSFQDNPAIEESLNAIQTFIIQQKALPNPFKANLIKDLATILENKQLNDITKLAMLSHRIKTTDAKEYGELINRIQKELNELYKYDSTIEPAVDELTAKMPKLQELKQQPPEPLPLPSWESVITDMIKIVKTYRSHLATEKSAPLNEKSFFNKLFSSHVDRKKEQYKNEDQGIHIFEILLNRLKNKEDVKNDMETLVEKFTSWEQSNRVRITKSNSTAGKGHFADKMSKDLDMLINVAAFEFGVKLGTNPEPIERKSSTRSSR